MKKSIKIIVPTLIISLAISIVVELNDRKEKPKKRTSIDDAELIFVDKVRQLPRTLKVTTHGEVKAKTMLTVVSQVSGMVQNISSNFVQGGRISANEVFANIDDTDYQVQIVRATAKVAEAKLNLEKNIADAEVAKKQLTSESHSSLALKKPHIENAKAQLASAKADLSLAKANLERTKIKLPFDVRITDKLIDRGQFVSVGTVLGSAFSTEKAEVQVGLTDKQLFDLGLPIGYQSNNTMGPEVTLSTMVAQQKRFWKGHIVRVDSALDLETRMFNAYAEISDPYGEKNSSHDYIPLAVGLYVSAEIVGKTIPNAYVIPRKALRSGNKVFVVDNGKLNIKQVEVLYQDADEVFINSGIDVNDLVAISPIGMPVQGMSVKARMPEGIEEERIVSSGKNY
ncbi:efflux RND transporter periplasmic adaptor subunit [Aliikangiella sp. IMCC44359]|uniref:efflux RND transporter periplasmic adaptor subunit n=1 Tax=Aliikangiella sp. IMCC44359 TaxID=3459125 RepID=UPI00403B150F